MSLESMAGKGYGPHPFRVCSDKVHDYVMATGDDPDRWNRSAPPAYASLALFQVAPEFLTDPEVAPFTRVLVHVDQTFRWHLPFAAEEVLSVRGSVERVRTRGVSHFVTFAMTVDNAAGERVLDADSTFLMSSETPDARPGEEPEPPVEDRKRNELAAPAALPSRGQPLIELPKSASRADLVRYAGASRDWNPIHFDHDAAVAAGLPGVVVHGLLMAAWATQAATRTLEGPSPLSDGRFRFRAALRPGEQAGVQGSVDIPDDGVPRFKVQVTADGTERVTAQMTARTA
jgi:acyl dehydratase